MTGTTSDFIYNLRDIITTNCVDSDVDVDSLTILDKLFICIKLRVNSIGPFLKVQFNEIVGEDGKPVVVTLNLEDIYTTMLSNFRDIGPLTISDEDQLYLIDCDIPTIGEEYQIDKELQSSIKNKLATTTSSESAQAVYTELFIQELAKYVKCISIKVPSDEDPTHYEVTDLKRESFENRIRLIGMLPNILTEKVVEYANATIKSLNSLQLVSVTVGEQTLKHNLEITTPSFFINS
jgi:hypothetical protein